jgi:hypothetical protein
MNSAASDLKEVGTALDVAYGAMIAIRDQAFKQSIDGSK